MLIVGLTGCIGSGKSTSACMFAKRGIPVYDADAVVHRLYSRGGAAVDLVRQAFPDVIVDEAVDRELLGHRIFSDFRAWTLLENIVHPLVHAQEQAFIRRAHHMGVRCAVLEIPLLMETGGNARCDCVVLTTAPEDVRRARALRRSNMSVARLDVIQDRQMSEDQKYAHAHFLIDTGYGLEIAEHAVDDILRVLAGMSAGTAMKMVIDNGAEENRA